MYPASFLLSTALSTFVTLLNGQSVPCDHPLAIAEGKGCNQPKIQVLTEMPEHNVGDDVDGKAGYKWFHDGINWIVVDCYYAVYHEPARYATLCGLGPKPDSVRDVANGYPVWEVGNVYYRAYPSQHHLLLGIIISPMNGKKILILQKTSEPFNYVVFQEDQQKEPWIKVP